MPHYLLTFLGTGPEDANGQKLRSYRSANYLLPTGKHFESSFVAKALWSTGEYDGFLLIGTMGSMWEEAYNAFAPTVDDAIAMRLYECAAAATEDTPLASDWLGPVVEVLPGKSRVCILEYGYTAESLAQNVALLTEALQVLPKGAELTLDITHGFRSLPFVALAALQSASIRVDAPYRLRHIRYGMLELSRQKGHAEVVSLDSVLQLERLARGAYIAQAYGRFVEIYEALPQNHPLRSPLKALDEGLALFRLQPSTDALLRVQQALATTNDPVADPVRWVVDSLLEGFRQNPKPSQIQFAFAKWFNRQRQFGGAIIYLVEAIVTRQCELSKLDSSSFDARERAKTELKVGGNAVLGRRYVKLLPIRNAVAHASKASVRVPEKDIADLNESLQALAATFA